MNENIINVSLTDAAASRAVYQYNSGQILRFEETIEDNTEIHFCNIKSEEAIVRRIVDNQVAIPTELIAEGLTITAYVHKVTADAETTIFEFDIQIKTRVMQDIEISEEDAKTYKQYIEEAVNNFRVAADEKIKINETMLKQIDDKGNLTIENINNTAISQIDAINNTATAQIQAATQNIDALTGAKIQNIDGLAGAKMNDISVHTAAQLQTITDVTNAKIGDINTTATAQLDAVNQTAQAQAKALEVQAEAHKQELLTIVAKERGWKKIRTITVPAADACGTTVDGITYGGNLENGIRMVTFSSDEEGNAFEGKGITGVRVRLTAVANETAINQGFLWFNEARVHYFTGIKPTTNATYVMEDCLTPTRIQPASSLQYTNYNQLRVSSTMGKEINRIRFEGFEETSILGEGATLEFWAYGYFED